MTGERELAGLRAAVRKGVHDAECACGDSGEGCWDEAQRRAEEAVRAEVEKWARGALSSAWQRGRADGHRELRPVNAFGETEAAVDPFAGSRESGQ